MTLEFLGSDPNSVNTWKCGLCGIVFDLKWDSDNEQIERDPDYCPFCGKALK